MARPPLSRPLSLVAALCLVEAWGRCEAGLGSSPPSLLCVSARGQRASNDGPLQSAYLLADGLLPPAGRRGAPIGPPGEQSGPFSLAKKKPDGALAAYLGTTDIPVDVMATFGGVGFLWGHLRAKLGRAAMWGGLLLAGGLALLSRNGYITIHWDKIQKDAMGTATYRYNEARKHGVLAAIPPDMQEQASRTIGKIQAAVEHNRKGIIWGLASLLIGIRVGTGSAEMPMG